MIELGGHLATMVSPTTRTYLCLGLLEAVANPPPRPRLPKSAANLPPKGDEDDPRG